jgi:hypothetical protein
MSIIDAHFSFYGQSLLSPTSAAEKTTNERAENTHFKRPPRAFAAVAGVVQRFPQSHALLQLRLGDFNFRECSLFSAEHPQRRRRQRRYAVLAKTNSNRRPLAMALIQSAKHRIIFTAAASCSGCQSELRAPCDRERCESNDRQTTEQSPDPGDYGRGADRRLSHEAATAMGVCHVERSTVQRS